MKRLIYLALLLLPALTLDMPHAEDNGFPVTQEINIGNMQELIDAIRAIPAVATTTVSSGGGTVTESTVTLTLSGGGVFLSTFGPISSTAFRISKSSFYVAGIDAFLTLPSSVGATSFKVWYTTADLYGIVWTTVTPNMVVSTNARQSVYISTYIPLYEGAWVAVGIDTIPINGLMPEGWGVNLHGINRRTGQIW